MKVVICAPDGWNDPASNYWCPAEAVYFARQVEKLGYQPIVLRATRANKKNYDEAVQQEETVMVTGLSLIHI